MINGSLECAAPGRLRVRCGGQTNCTGNLAFSVECLSASSLKHTKSPNRPVDSKQFKKLLQGSLFFCSVNFNFTTITDFCCEFPLLPVVASSKQIVDLGFTKCCHSILVTVWEW